MEQQKKKNEIPYFLCCKIKGKIIQTTQSTRVYTNIGNKHIWESVMELTVKLVFPITQSESHYTNGENTVFP